MSKDVSEVKTTTGTLTCPSYTCQPGARLVGVVGPDGRLRYLHHAPSIDETFVQIAERGRAPELRFRFAGACVKCKCRNWEDGACGVVERAIRKDTEVSNKVLPACGIRRDCRWFAQRGTAACTVCPEIVRGAAPLFFSEDS